MVSKKKKVAGQIYVKSLDETAFVLDTFRTPMLRRQHEKVIADLHKTANIVRHKIGEKPKEYKTIKDRKLVKI